MLTILRFDLPPSDSSSGVLFFRSITELCAKGLRLGGILGACLLGVLLRSSDSFLSYYSGFDSFQLFFLFGEGFDILIFWPLSLSLD